MLYLKEK